jgi:ribose transport system substrate-binding protein
VNLFTRGASVALIVLITGALIAACGSDDSDDSDAPAADVPQIQVDRDDTVGPGGSSATPSEEVKLTPAQEEEVKAGGFTAALMAPGPGTSEDALNKATKERLAELNIEVVAETNSEFDAAKQQRDLESVLARKPDVIIALPVDPVSSAKGFRQARNQGIELVFTSNIPDGFEHGKDYVGVISADVRQMARRSAQLLANSLGGEGKVGYIFHDANFFITNQWDRAFKQAIENEFPGMEIVAEQGFEDPAKVEEVASAMLTRNPDIDGIYTTWQEPAEGVLAALRDQGRDDVKVTTVGLSEIVAVDLAEGGAMAGVSAENVPEVGRATGDMAGLALLGEEAPAFAAADAISITPDSVVEGWREAYGVEPPEAVIEAAGS